MATELIFIAEKHSLFWDLFFTALLIDIALRLIEYIRPARAISQEEFLLPAETGFNQKQWAEINHNHNLNDLLEKSYNSLTDKPFIPATFDDLIDGIINQAFTATEKTKLLGIESGAEVNINSDWNAVSGDALILNKPAIPPDINFGQATIPFATWLKEDSITITGQGSINATSKIFTQIYADNDDIYAQDWNPPIIRNVVIGTGFDIILRPQIGTYKGIVKINWSWS